MAVRRGRLTLVSLLGLLLVGGGAWSAAAVRAVRAVSALSDPAKLATLGERGANSRLNKVVYWLDEARRWRMPPETAIGLAQRLNGTREPRAALVRLELLRNLKIADELGLLTPENRTRLRQGHAGVITRGPYQGKHVEIDHIVPLSLAPEVGNELANLEMLPEPLNRAKSNRVGARQVSHAETLAQAGLLTQESLARVRAHAKRPPRQPLSGAVRFPRPPTGLL